MKKINKIDKTLARPNRGHRNSIQINKIRNKKVDITTETGNSKNHHILLQKLICNKIGNMDEMDNFLDTYHMPKLK